MPNLRPPMLCQQMLCVAATEREKLADRFQLVGGTQHTSVCAADHSPAARARLGRIGSDTQVTDRAGKRFVTVMSHFYLEQATAKSCMYIS